MRNLISKKNIATAILGVVALSATTIIASAQLEKGAVIGKSEAEIRLALEQQNYVIDEIEMEDGTYEVEVTLNDREMELEIDANTGEILEIETEDENDD